MIEIPKQILVQALGEADIELDDVDWQYDNGYRTCRTYFSFVSEDGVRSLAKVCTILGSMAETEGEDEIDFHMAMSFADSAQPIQRGRRSGFCFPGIQVV